MTAVTPSQDIINFNDLGVNFETNNQSNLLDSSFFMPFGLACRAGTRGGYVKRKG